MFNKTDKCFYVDNIAGRCAANLYGKYSGNFNTITFIPIKEGCNKLDFNIISANDSVIILGIPVRTSDMDILLQITEDITLIDDTVGVEYAEYPPQIFGSRLAELKFCDQTYMYFFVISKRERESEIQSYNILKLMSIPLYVTYCSGSDVRYSKHLFLAINLLDTSPTSVDWDYIAENTKLLLNCGLYIEKYKNQMYGEIISMFGYEVELNGLKFFTCNTTLSAEELFPFIPKESDCLIAYHFNGTSFKFDVFCSVDAIKKSLEIVKSFDRLDDKYYECDHIPFTKINTK